MSDDGSRAAVAAGMLGSEEQHQALLQSIVDVARSIFRREGVVDPPPRRGGGRARLRGRRRGGLGAAGRTALSRRSTGIAGWVLVSRQPLVIEDVLDRPALLARDRREHRLRPEGADGRAASPRRATRSACSRCSTGPATQVHARGDGSPRPVREPGGDRARPAAAGPRGRRAPLAGEGDLAVVARVAEALETRRDDEDDSRQSALRLLVELEKLLQNARSPGAPGLQSIRGSDA